MSKRILMLLALGIGALAAQDPPDRVARLNYISGSVSFQPAGVQDWVSATINRPMTIGDQLWADDGARAEMQIPGASMRLASRTAFQFLNLDDQTVQIKLSEGSLNVHVRRLDPNNSFEVDTPNVAVTLLREGDYRIDTNPDTFETYVTVRGGDSEVTGGGQAFNVKPNQQAYISGNGQLTFDLAPAPAPDEFDQWSESRVRREDRALSARYVSPEVVGYQDLDEYGSWRPAPGYGPVWYPSVVAPGWAPYHYGHWAWIEPWGWSWVDDAPWGFAPFHYGRWAFIGGRWGWCPGPVAVRPVYAPALVAWFGGGGFSIGAGFGGGAVGWFPLGPREVYIPSYRVSPAYVSRVNVTNTTINNTYVANVYNTYVNNGSITNVRYVNRTIPGATTVVPGSALQSARPVQQVAVRLQPNQMNELARARFTAAPPVVPRRASVLGRPGQGNAEVVRPPAAVMSRPVVARIAPPAPVAPFAQRQAALARNPGHPLPMQEIRESASRGAPRMAEVRVAPEAVRVNPPVRQTARPAQPVWRGQPAESRGVSPEAAQPRVQQPSYRPAPRAQEPAYRPSAPAQERPRQPTYRPNNNEPRPNVEESRPNAPEPRAQPRPAPRPYEPPREQERTQPQARPAPEERQARPYEPPRREQRAQPERRNESQGEAKPREKDKDQR